MDLGNEYTVLYGQLKDIRVKEGTMVNAGEVIAKSRRADKLLHIRRNESLFSDGKR